MVYMGSSEAQIWLRYEQNIFQLFNPLFSLNIYKGIQITMKLSEFKFGWDMNKRKFSAFLSFYFSEHLQRNTNHYEVIRIICWLVCTLCMEHVPASTYRRFNIKKHYFNSKLVGVLIGKIVWYYVIRSSTSSYNKLVSYRRIIMMDVIIFL